MAKHLDVEPENRGFDRVMKIAATGASFEAVQYTVEYVEHLAAENKADHRYAMGMRTAFTTIAQILPHRGGPLLAVLFRDPGVLLVVSLGGVNG